MELCFHIENKVAMLSLQYDILLHLLFCTYNTNGTFKKIQPITKIQKIIRKMLLVPIAGACQVANLKKREKSISLQEN